MAEKRFYWLKLKEDYFNSPKIKKLRKIAGGDTYTIIYLKMQLLSVRNGGIIPFENIEPTLEEELALKLDEDLENVKVTLAYLQTQSLLEANEDNQYLLIEASNSIGSEGQSAERKRRFDARKALQSNGSVTEVKRNSISISNSISNSNIYNTSNEEKGMEKETKHKFGEYQNVLLKDSEFEKLKQDYGEEETNKAITFLDEYIEMKGYKAKSHNLALRKWVFNAVKEQEQRERRVQEKEPKKDKTIDILHELWEEADKKEKEQNE